MTCQDVQRALDAQLIGTSSRDEAEALDAHLEACPECQRLVADARRLQAELRLVGTDGPSPRAWDRIAARLEADPDFQRAAAEAIERDPRTRRRARGGRDLRLGYRSRVARRRELTQSGHGRSTID